MTPITLIQKILGFPDPMKETGVLSVQWKRSSNMTLI